MADPTVWLALVIIAALAFDFINGFNDAANAVATSVATGVMSIRTAVIVAGIFNFAGALAGTAVASFLASGLVSDPSLVTPAVIFSALMGATCWNLLTWWYGIPSSSSHALIGGLAGAVVAHTNAWSSFQWTKLLDKVLIPLVESPAIGFMVAFTVMVAAMWICRGMRPAKVNRGARILQFISGCTLAFSHGMNDAQKVMGIITLTLVAFMAGHGLKPLLTPARGQDGAQFTQQVATYRQQLSLADPPATIDPVRSDRDAYDACLAGKTALPLLVRDHAPTVLPSSYLAVDKTTQLLVERNDIPFWVILACACSMCLGTIAGGKKIIKTMGSKISRMNPLQGFAAQASGTGVIIGFSMAGIPLSTTHCISASIMGVGTSKGLARVRWTVALNMVAAWIVTIPASGSIAWLTEKTLKHLTGG